MPESTELLLAACMMLGAALYSSVGHAGASAYLALMALFSVPAVVMRPTALVLNIIVGLIGSWRYARSGLFRFRTLWPFLLGALPMAFFGGYLQVPGEVYRPLVGLILLIAALRLFVGHDLKQEREWKDPPIPIAILLGAGIGLLAGLTGTGGGIFLSPLVIFMAWSETRNTSGVAIVFILLNSLAGLLGNYSSVGALPAALPLYAGAVIIGAMIGTSIGIGRLANRGLLRALGLVLVIAGLKLIGLY